ncbi:MAG: uncharacterized protein FD165_1072 [Gammaproteobacteria bacterium]|nr:MAG: uncharacterized protein FD165_1072 [Gammaproteobacteria bacterium]TND06220.1 MAG: uncharacterized protein FD120_707 [Gammaproteobacteria bacterium]
MMLTFATPLWLAALPLPALIWAALRQARSSAPISPGAAALLHSQADLLARLAARQQHAVSRMPWLWLAGCMLLIGALARPQWTTPNTASDYYGRDFMLALDVSGSMRALDFSIDGQPTDRLTMVKRIVDGFLDERRGDRVGIIVFADDAYSLAPVTTDKALLKQILDEVDNGTIGEKTALGNALALAVKRLRDRREEARVLILLTDGTNTSGEITPEAAIAMARYYHVRVYTVGIGSQERTAFPRGKMQTAEFAELPVDDALLQHIADATGGRFYAARNSADMQRILRDIDKLADVPVTDERAWLRRDIYALPLTAGLLLLLGAQWRATRQILPASPVI